MTRDELVRDMLQESTSKLIFINGLGFTVVPKKKEDYFSKWLRKGGYSNEKTRL